ncbi:iron-containing alcohol dehydrogenase [Aureimonas psammosilenae]|uniref:iron-containing alcohol dehydrogenase n=1 Tax=Aureimonas psammosilenae TaxID=2495496 RepID=UPI001260DF94|nr:iron-containing alcohol dehydrogenase [Aureimonas psammosilenae]
MSQSPSPQSPRSKLGLQLTDLGQLDRIRDALSRNDPRSQFEPLGLREIVVGENVLPDVAETVARHLREAGVAPDRSARVLMMVDPVTIRRDGADFKKAVFAELSGRFDAAWTVLNDGHAVMHADDPVIDEAARFAVGAQCIVSVGGGTVTDVAKIAAQRNGVPVHVVVQTAASVDGFTDNFSVVLQNGVKRTLLTRWPEAVLADTRVIATAPHVLNASGFGELLSMYSAPGDWFLACQMGLDQTYAPVLLDLLELCGEDVETWSSGVRSADHDSCARLAKALLMRGIVTGVGGTTAPLSGMEHLFSHMLDMVSGERGEPTGLHGAQVGVGSVIRAAAWEEFRDRWNSGPVALDRLFPAAETLEATVRDAFATIDPSGRLGEECWSRYRRKLADWHASRAKVEAFFGAWDEKLRQHEAMVLSSGAIAANLHRAGSAKRSRDLEPAPSDELTRWVVANCQFMRERFTVADLLLFCGWWDEAGIARVLARVEAACAAAEDGAR